MRALDTPVLLALLAEKNERCIVRVRGVYVECAECGVDGRRTAYRYDVRYCACFGDGYVLALKREVLVGLSATLS